MNRGGGSMSQMGSEAVAERRAAEALRNGVPNGDAVRALGSNQTMAETAFRQRLDAMSDALAADDQVPGLLISGGFGTGKSHLLEYLEHVASVANLVTSRVVISKETPLYDPAKLFRAAVESARVPGRGGMAIAEIAVSLRQDTRAYADLYVWANLADSQVAAIFPATLLLHERLNNDPELVEQIRSFWAGDRLPVKFVRDGLRQIGEAAAFPLKAVRARELTEQRWAFVTRLILGAGYAGWALFIDEVELVGRYSLLQRAKSYAELARWMGKVEGLRLPGLLTVAAVTDDFAAAVLEEKGDRDYVGPRLRDKGTDEYLAIAARAEAGMRLIERESLRLEPPTDERLRTTYDRLRSIHGSAYGWEPPDIAWADRSLTRPIRSYVRRWINEWDLLRLYPGETVETEEVELRPTYQEDQSLEEPESPPNDMGVVG